ncbi:unnamed protein product [Rotaria socialis]
MLEAVVVDQSSLWLRNFDILLKKRNVFSWIKRFEWGIVLKQRCLCNNDVIFLIGSTALISYNPSISTPTQLFTRRMGFNAKNKHAIDSVYICQICDLILRDPVQLNCGDRLCKSCVEAKEGEKIQCPACGEQSDKKDVLLDRGYKNDMQTLPIECTHCNWHGSLKQYQTKHENQL